MAVVQYKTPGVYVEELDAFPPSIVGVETAVPAFIGYTERAEQNGRSVMLRAVRISSMVDFKAIFGGAFDYRFTVTPIPVTQADVDLALNMKNAADAAQAEAKAAHDKLQANASEGEKAADALKLKSATEAAERAAAQYATLKKSHDDDPGFGKAENEAIAAADAAKKIEADLKSDDPTKKAAAEKARDDAVAAKKRADTEFKKVRPNASIGGKGFQVSVDTKFSLYNSLRLFYANHGGDCYIVSVGDYGSTIGYDDLKAGLDQVHDKVGPTMLVIPEAVALTQDG